MTRKLPNGRYCVRSGNTVPSPYLRDNISLLVGGRKNLSKIKAIDLGCGNLRNTRFLKMCGLKNITPIDMVDDCAEVLVLGRDQLPFRARTINVILCNYVFMFLSPEERVRLCREINRVAAKGCTIMVELAVVKHSYLLNTVQMRHMLWRLFHLIGWERVSYSPSGRFIARKP